MGFLESLRQAVRGLPNGRSRDMVERLNLKVMRFYEEGRFREATESARQLLEVQRQEVGEDHPDYATALSNLGLLLQRQGDLEGAEPLLRQVLATRKQALGESHPDHATSLNNLGELLSLREDLGGAEPLLHQALAVRKQVLGENHPDYAVSLSSLALLRHKRGDLDGAEALLAQALEIRREMLGEFHPDYAAGLSNLANLLVERGELARAEVLLRQALQIRRAALGEQHPDSLATSRNLARLLHRRAEMPGSRVSAARLATEGSGAGPDQGVVDGPSDSVARASAPEPDRERIAVSDLPGWIAEGEDIAAQGVEELARLTDLFREVGRQLQAAGERMRSDGEIPDPGVFRALAVCHHRLSSLGTEVRGLAGSLGVPSAPDDRVDGLREIGTLLAGVARVKAERSRAAALAVLERVLALRPLAPEVQPTLERCQDRAKELHRIVAAGPASEPLPVAEQLARGEHPFANLLSLIDDREPLDDARRADLRRGVAWAFGEPLAERAAEARLLVHSTGDRGGEAAIGAEARDH